MSRVNGRTNFPTLLITAVSALVLGVLIYATVRTPGSTYFLPVAWSTELPWPAAALQVAGNLPTFFHTLGFCLILTVLAGSGRCATAWICIAWFVVETAFEVGQHPRASAWLMEHLTPWFNHVWMLEHTGTYFSAGVFDPFDVIAAATGSALAFLLVATKQS